MREEEAAEDIEGGREEEEKKERGGRGGEEKKKEERPHSNQCRFTLHCQYYPINDQQANTTHFRFDNHIINEERVTERR